MTQDEDADDRQRSGDAQTQTERRKIWTQAVTIPVLQHHIRHLMISLPQNAKSY